MALLRWRDFGFFLPRPSPRPGAHLLTIQFEADGPISTQAETDDPAALIGRLRWLLAEIAENPALLAAMVLSTEESARAAGLQWRGLINVPPPVDLRELGE